MVFKMDAPDGVLSLFGYQDAYAFLNDLVSGSAVHVVLPLNVKLSVGDDSSVILRDGHAMKGHEAMLRRLWSRPEDERTWEHARRVFWNGSRRTLVVEF